MYSTLIYLLATTGINQDFAIIPPITWLIIGVILSICEFLIPQNIGQKYRFILLIMGLCAFSVSFMLWLFAERMGFSWYYVNNEGYDIQILYWMGLSLTSIIWIRPMFIRRKVFVLPEANEAVTITEILPGETGRVLYEGGSWKARCDGYQESISARQKVYVLRRESNTLIVAPDKLFRL